MRVVGPSLDDRPHILGLLVRRMRHFKVRPPVYARHRSPILIKQLNTPAVGFQRISVCLGIKFCFYLEREPSLASRFGSMHVVAFVITLSRKVARLCFSYQRFLCVYLKAMPMRSFPTATTTCVSLSGLTTCFTSSRPSSDIISC